MLGKLFSSPFHPGPKVKGYKRFRRSLLIEQLEDRRLLSLTATLTTFSPLAGSSVTYGQSVMLTATVTAAPPNTGGPTNGLVTFDDGNIPLGSVSVNAKASPRST